MTGSIAEVAYEWAVRWPEDDGGEVEERETEVSARRAAGPYVAADPVEVVRREVRRGQWKPVAE